MVRADDVLGGLGGGWKARTNWLSDTGKDGEIKTVLPAVIDCLLTKWESSLASFVAAVIFIFWCWCSCCCCCGGGGGGGGFVIVFAVLLLLLFFLLFRIVRLFIIACGCFVLFYLYPCLFCLDLCLSVCLLYCLFMRKCFIFLADGANGSKNCN